MKKKMMFLSATLILCGVGANGVQAQNIGQNAKALGSQIADSVKTKAPVIVEKVKDTSVEIKDSVVAKAPEVWDSIKSKSSQVGDKAIIVADSVLTKSKRWIDRHKKN